jgi:hypothetical protein
LLSSVPLCLPRCGGFESEPWPEEGKAGTATRDAAADGRSPWGRDGGSAGAGNGGTSQTPARDASSETSWGGAGSAAAGDASVAPILDAGQGGRAADAGASVVVRINEVNANISKGCDLVELRVVTGGNMYGVELWARTSAVLTFGALAVERNDLIIVHMNATTCNPEFESEQLSKTQTRAPGTYATAYDWYSTSAGLVSTDLVLTLYDAQGRMLDAALFADDTTGTAATQSEEQAQAVATAKHWVAAGTGIPASGFVDDTFCAHAAQDLNATGISAPGESIGRVVDEDHDSAADWLQGASSWGHLNSG